MIIYLDQNMWIDLSKIYHGKDTTDTSISLIEIIGEKLAADKIQLPISQVHYLEAARISNEGRRKRLGTTMFYFSKGKTVAAYRTIVVSEIENALANFYSHIKPRGFNLIGFGVEHAFRIVFPQSISYKFRPIIERSFLTGEDIGFERISGFNGQEYSQKFQNHLINLKEIKITLSPDKWDDALYAIALNDILEPLNEVLSYWKINVDDFISLGKEGLGKILTCMPSRKLELHLHKQILKNSEYVPKVTDLEDWAGVGLASQYCDVVVAEKHMADMLKRDKFTCKATVLNKLSDLLPLISNL